MIERGILCILIGAFVLIAPNYLSSPDWRATVGGAYVVGWFALTLGIALVLVALIQRAKAKNR